MGEGSDRAAGWKRPGNGPPEATLELIDLFYEAADLIRASKRLDPRAQLADRVHGLAMLRVCAWIEAGTSTGAPRQGNDAGPDDVPPHQDPEG